MNNNELAVIITLFAVACLLFIVLAIAAFYVGFCIGDSDNRKNVNLPQKKPHKKKKPPDSERERYDDKLKELLLKVDGYNGDAPIVKKDGDRI